MKAELYNLPRFRKFSVKYLSPAAVRGSRVKITDERHKKSKTIRYDSEIGDTCDQAVHYLNSIGIPVGGLALGDLDSEIHILSHDFTTPLK
jgi:hypothetical protein